MPIFQNIAALNSRLFRPSLLYIAEFADHVALNGRLCRPFLLYFAEFADHVALNCRVSFLLYFAEFTDPIALLSRVCTLYRSKLLTLTNQKRAPVLFRLMEQLGPHPWWPF